MARMRVALFGGTFDPIHRGHLALASAAASAFALDRVLFAPVGRQPLKAESPAATFADRLEMTRLAIASAADPRFAVSSVDAPRPDGAPNYTVDTLAAVALRVPIVVVSYDAVPGRASRLAAHFAKVNAVALPGSTLRRAVVTGATSCRRSSRWSRCSISSMIRPRSRN